MPDRTPPPAAPQPPGPILKSTDDIEAIARAGQILDHTLRALARAATPGVTTVQLDELAKRLIDRAGATPAFPGQRDRSDAPPYPAAITASRNDQILHAPPNPDPLRPGDLLTIDTGINLHGWHADAAISLVIHDPAARPSPHPTPAHRVARGAHAVLQTAIDRFTPGVRWSAIARAMQAHAEHLELGIVTDFVGHGIGANLHELPKAPAWWSDSDFDDFELTPGLVLAVEPIVTQHPGRTRTIQDPDGWTIRTADASLAAHAEAVLTLDPATARARILAGGWEHPALPPRAPDRPGNP